MKRINFLWVAALLGLLSCAKTVTTPTSTVGTFKTDPTGGGSRLAWDYSTLRKIAPLPGQGVGYHGYARLIQRADSTLLCVYEASGSVEMVRSTDGGKTWSGRVVVAAKEPGVSMAVPEIVELADRSLLVSYNPRPGRNATGKRFGIRTIKSYDGGATWKDGRLVYEAGTEFGNGCWEPVALQLPSGEVQLYFSDEGIYTTSNEQNISLMRSADGGLTWTATPEIVSFRAGKRDGMPVPVLLNGTEIAFSIEDNARTTFKPYIIRNALADNWKSGPVGGDSPSRNYALSQPLSESVYAGAPYLRQLRTGETILGVQSTENRASNNMNVSRLLVYLGDREARNFGHASEPFAIEPTKSGLWNSLSVLNDNTVVALTSTNSYAGNSSEVWMIKGYVIPEQVATARTIQIDGNLTASEWPTTLPVFVGHRGGSQLRAGFAYSDDYLFVGARVTDKQVVTDSPTPLDDDGIWITVDALSNSPKMLGSSINKVIVSADGRVMAQKKTKEDWTTYTGSVRNIRSKVTKNAAGYVVELAIPWKLLDGKPPVNTRINYTLGLTSDDDGGPADYIDGMDISPDNKLFTWCGLLLE